MLGLINNGAKSHFLPLYCIRLQLHFYSTAPAGTRLSDFLVNSLGFSQKEVLSTISKVTRSRLKNYNPHLCIALFEEMGLNKTQIKSLVSSCPVLLFSHVDNNLKPKIKVLHQLGLSGYELVACIRKGDFLRRSLDNTIKPSIDYLKGFLGNNRTVASVLNREPRLLSNNLAKVIPPNILVLQNLGFSRADIETVFLRCPRYLLSKPEWLERVVHRVEKDFGIPREARMFLHGIEAFVSHGDANMEAKLDIFRSFGWSEADICRMVQRLPYCLTASEAKITTMLKFYMNELGFQPSYLASHAPLLKYSLKKRVMPRNEILKFLGEKKLIKGTLSLYTVVSCSESLFLEKYVLPYSAKMPEIYDLYVKTRS